jgi:transposase
MAIGTDDAVERYAGVDVGKDWLELAVDGGRGAPTRRFANTPTGVGALVRALQRAAPRLVAVEATGAYLHPLLQALGGAAVPVAVVNPAQVNAFRQTRLGRNKTDRQDALLLARFAAVHAPELRAYAPPAAQQELRRLLVYRDAVSKWRTVLRNQQEVSQWTGAEAVGGWLAEDLAATEARLRTIDAAIQRVLARLPEAAVLRAVKGAGPLVVAAVLAYLPVAVWGRAKAAAACAGVHPAILASGRTERSRLSRSGSSRLRRYLYLGALAARVWDPDMRAFYERLVGRGKAKQAAIVAVMHKLLRRLMGRLRAFHERGPTGEQPPAPEVVPPAPLLPAPAA